MKKKLLTLLACAGMASCVQADDVTGHTFYLIRPPFWSSSPEKVSLFRDAPYARCDGWGSAFQIVPFGGRSTKANGLNKFFTFGGLSELQVLEDNTGAQTDPATNPGLRTVNPAHFNIYTAERNANKPFQSTISFSPQHTYWGVGLTYQHHFGCDKKWWWEISMPVMYVNNNMHLKEVVEQMGVAFDDSTSLGASRNAARNVDMTEAFKGLKPISTTSNGVSAAGKGWNYGKIDGAHKKWGVADIELKLGEDLVNEETCHMGGYVGLMLPTGNKSKAVNVFEPMIGRGQFGFMLGLAAGFEVWSGCDSTIRWELDGTSRYLLSNTQVRTFDLQGKPWSRYMIMFANQAEAASVGTVAPYVGRANGFTEGINILTQKVRVKPRFEYNVNSAFVYDYCRFQGELGYNFYARQSESIKLKTPWVEGPALVSLDASGDIPANTINRAITIGENFTNAGVVTTAATYSTLLIKEQDLDLQSAAAPAALTNTIYASLAYVADDWCCYPMRFGLGGSYEFSGDNSGLSRWMVWGKWVVSL
jgi:hypothetical protein